MTRKSKPDLVTFLRSMNLQVSRYLLKKVGSKRHEIQFITPARSSFYIPDASDVYTHNIRLESVEYRLISRGIGFANLGILCSSATTPSLREITLQAEIIGGTPIKFGPNHVLREGFEGEETKSGAGKTYCHRIDYAKRDSHTDKSSELLVLNAGVVYYPFTLCGTGLYHEPLWEAHRTELGEQTVLSDQDRESVISDFEDVKRMISVNVIVVLDSGELLAFHWNHEDDHFEDDFFNVGFATT